MIESFEATEQIIWLQPLLIIAGSILVGLFIEYVVLGGLRRLSRTTHWPGDDLLIRVVQGMPILWCTLAGVYQAWLYLASQDVSWAPSISLQLVGRTVTVIVLISVTIVLMRLVVGSIKYFGRTDASSGSGAVASVSILTNLVRIIILSLSLLIILEYVGVSVTPALAALGVGGLAISLGLQETLSNLFSGVLIVASRQIRPGNYVQLNSGEEGYVTDINWRTTQIRSLANNMVIVPNSAMTSAIVVNYDVPEQELSILFDIGVDYDSDLDHVERVTIEVGNQVLQDIEGGVVESETYSGTFIRYNQFADFSINFTVILRGREFVNQYLIKHEFVKRLHRRYREEGIVIPFPIRTLHSMNSDRLEVTSIQRHNGRAAGAGSGRTPIEAADPPEAALEADTAGDGSEGASSQSAPV